MADRRRSPQEADPPDPLRLRGQRQIQVQPFSHFLKKSLPRNSKGVSGDVSVRRRSGLRSQLRHSSPSCDGDAVASPADPQGLVGEEGRGQTFLHWAQGGTSHEDQGRGHGNTHMHKYTRESKTTVSSARGLPVNCYPITAVSQQEKKPVRKRDTSRTLRGSVGPAKPLHSAAPSATQLSICLLPFSTTRTPGLSMTARSKATSIISNHAPETPGSETKKGGTERYRKVSCRQNRAREFYLFQR